MFKRNSSTSTAEDRFERRVMIFNNSIRISMILLYLALWYFPVKFVVDVLRPSVIAYLVLAAIIVGIGIYGWVKFWKWYDQQAQNLRGPIDPPSEQPARYHYQCHIKGGIREVLHVVPIALLAIVVWMLIAQGVWHDWFITSVGAAVILAIATVVSYLRWTVTVVPYNTLSPGVNKFVREQVSKGGLFTDGSTPDLLDIGSGVNTPMASFFDVIFGTVTLSLVNTKGKTVILRDIPYYDHLKALLLWTETRDKGQQEQAKRTADGVDKLVEYFTGGSQSQDVANDEPTISMSAPDSPKEADDEDTIPHGIPPVPPRESTDPNAPTFTGQVLD